MKNRIKGGEEHKGDKNNNQQDPRLHPGFTKYWKRDFQQNKKTHREE